MATFSARGGGWWSSISSTTDSEKEKAEDALDNLTSFDKVVARSSLSCGSGGESSGSRLRLRGCVVSARGPLGFLPTTVHTVFACRWWRGCCSLCPHALGEGPASGGTGGLPKRWCHCWKWPLTGRPKDNESDLPGWPEGCLP